MPDLLPVARVSSNDRAGIRQRPGSAEARPVPPVSGSRRGRESRRPTIINRLGGRLRAARVAAGKQRPGREKFLRQEPEETEDALGNASDSCLSRAAHPPSGT